MDPLRRRALIGLSTGHGGPDHDEACVAGGKCATCGTKAGLGYGILEATYVRGLADKVADALLGAPIDLLPLTAPDETVKPPERGRRARAMGCDGVVCLHVNEGSAGAHGLHAFHFKPDQRAIEAAVVIARAWPTALRRTRLHGVRLHSGVYAAGMVEPATKALWPDAHWLLSKYMPTPTVLVEAFYASCPTDCVAARDEHIQWQMALAIAQGIMELARVTRAACVV